MNINIERKYKLLNKRVTVSFSFYSCFLIFLRRNYLQISLEEIICIVSRYFIIEVLLYQVKQQTLSPDFVFTVTTLCGVPQIVVY